MRTNPRRIANRIIKSFDDIKDILESSGIVIPEGTPADQYVDKIQEALGGSDRLYSGLGDNSWNMINNISVNEIAKNDMTPQQVFDTYGWGIGDMKTIHINGSSYPVVLIGINHDDIVLGPKAGLTFEMHPILYGKSLADGSTYMSKASPYLDGWLNSNIRLNVLPSIFNSMIPELQSVIKTVSKKYAHGGTGKIMYSEDKLFLLSDVEYTGMNFNANAQVQGSRYSFYTISDPSENQVNRKKFAPPRYYSNTVYWTRSPSSNNTGQWTIVNHLGQLAGANSSAADYPFSFAFCV